MSHTYHFIGIGGIGMSALAHLLLTKKIGVSGSDLSFNAIIEGLIQNGAIIYRGHASDHICPEMTVVYTTGIEADNPEYAAAKRYQCPLMHRSELLSQLVEGHEAIAITGTHGKTTTSALLAAVLTEAQLDPSFMVGGILPQFQTNAHLGEGKHFVFEADESDGSFLNYFPMGAIVTNIDRDHLNYYEGSEERLKEAFRLFMQQVKSPEHLFWCYDNEPLRNFNPSAQSYGFHPNAKWRASNFRQRNFALFFDIEVQGEIYRDVEVSLIGSHNALNALAVFGIALTLGVPEERIRLAFKQFKGVMRRCEKKGEMHGILFLDDYAHHTTEIQLTLEAIRQETREKRLVVVFQPHRYSRIQDCLGSYGPVFDKADQLFITDIYAAGEVPVSHLSHTLIMQEIEACSTIPMEYVPRSALSHRLAQFVQPHDVVVTLGAGDVTKVCPEIGSYLEKQGGRRLKIGLIVESSLSKDEASLQSIKCFRTALRQEIYQVKEFQMGKSASSISDLAEELGTCDMLIPLLHDSSIEGIVQGFLEMLGKAYAGCDYFTATVCLNKKLSKQTVQLHGIKIVPAELESQTLGKEFVFTVLGHDQVEVFPSKETWEELPLHLVEEGKRLAEIVYRIIECSGIASIHFFWIEGNYYFEKVTSMVGWAVQNIYLQFASCHELSISHVVDKLIQLALQRRRQQDRLSHAKAKR